MPGSDVFNIYTEIDDASSCCWKWWNAARSFFVRSIVVGFVVVEFGLLLLLFVRLERLGDGAVANIVGL